MSCRKSHSFSRASLRHTNAWAIAETPSTTCRAGENTPAAEHTLLNARLTKLKERVDKLDEQARQERLAREAEEARQKQKEAGLLNAEKSKREAADKSAGATRNRTIDSP